MNDFRKTQYKQEDLNKAIERLREMCGGDDELLADMVEGETDLDQFVEKLVIDIQLAKANAAAAKKVAADIKEREKRFNNRADGLTGMIFSLLDRVGVDRLELPTATVSVKSTAKQMIVTEEADIPAKYWKTGDPTLNKTALKADLKERDNALINAGKIEDEDVRKAAIEAANKSYPEIKGATLDNGGKTLQVRVN